MIIRKKNVQKSKSSSSTPAQKQSKSSVIKKEDINPAVIQPKGEQIIENTPMPSKKAYEMDDFEKIDISSIEFKERVERRRGDRRRGYRRIDERSLVTRAQQEAHTIKELAAKEGYKSGFREAQNELEQLKKTLSEFLCLKDDMYEKFYPHIAEIALAATEKIIKKEVELSDDVLKNVIISAMDELNSDTQKVEIKVNSQDVEFARASLPEIIESKGEGAKVTINADDSIEQGSCIIVANNGVIDARFSTQLAVLQNAFGIYKGGM
ncbi:MAG: hypothetical protein IJ877_00525 [Candidatus Gastranaerophilales bacterium]|nr:hypothetical protein [Candidatus Gastranaerophilales bacterium]